MHRLNMKRLERTIGDAERGDLMSARAKPAEQHYAASLLAMMSNQMKALDESHFSAWVSIEDTPAEEHRRHR